MDYTETTPRQYEQILFIRTLVMNKLSLQAMYKTHGGLHSGRS